jgi:hypothetical protein
MLSLWLRVDSSRRRASNHLPVLPFTILENAEGKISIGGQKEMSYEIWLKIAGWIVPPVATALLEYRFGIVGRLKKLYFYSINKDAGFEVNLTFTKHNDFEKLKKAFIEIVREKFDKAPIKKDSPTKIEILTDNYLTTMNLMPNSQIFISTTRVECGIRTLKKKLSAFLGIVNKLKKKGGISSREISFKVFVPFKWTYVNIRSPKGLKLNDYDITFDENDFNSVIKLKMSSLSVTGDEESLGYILSNFISIF